MMQFSSNSSAEDQDDVRVRHILTLHQDNVLSLCINGKTLFSGSADCTIKVLHLNIFIEVKGMGIELFQTHQNS